MWSNVVSCDVRSCDLNVWYKTGSHRKWNPRPQPLIKQHTMYTYTSVTRMHSMWHHVTSCDIMWHHVTSCDIANLGKIVWHCELGQDHVTSCDIMCMSLTLEHTGPVLCHHAQWEFSDTWNSSCPKPARMPPNKTFTHVMFEFFPTVLCLTLIVLSEEALNSRSPEIHKAHTGPCKDKGLFHHIPIKKA